MKTKRILSALLGLVMILALLPATAFAAAAEIKTVAVTVSDLVWGKPRPGIGSVSVADSANLQVTGITWTTNDDGRANLYNRIQVTVEIKPGVDAKFVKETSIKASINGDSSGMMKKRKSDTQVVLTYTIKLKDPDADAKKAAAEAAAAEAIGSTDVPESYDTFDYRAYANVYPDVKAAYGYDAQKLWAHYVNYGKAEGRVATYIEASKNPKTNAPIYGVVPGTTPDTSEGNTETVVPATLLDPIAPQVAAETAVWVRDRNTVLSLASNAKLVAEYYAAQEYWEMWKTISAWHVEPTEMRWMLIADELSVRARTYQGIYDYEHSTNHTTTQTQQYERAKNSETAKTVYKSDPTILLHWLKKFPTPPADPGTAGQTSTTATTPAKMAYASTQTVDLDGRKVGFQMYALRDASGGETNYIKVRDLAMALNGTAARFSVDWNGAVNLAAGAAYTPNGSENTTPFSGDRAYKTPTSPTNVNGKVSDLQAIVLTDDKGGDYTYYKLRDLGQKLGFNVGWSAERGVFIETGKPYTDAD